ncbi:MAG: multidrug ABC transporter ATP-binding protein [Candidatus Omnitrophica bacterium CG08_land_8_20_14_0_20_41_16]|uniref:Multidrug ABC transporter ATP-binding protein n=1 Tax=Candidatus Sherwoodlollariibacterium unditelluris TaxID=1974757 RepID=A0A2G9YK86_9BACT|nr:MAG: multidrug ABC transporter ATP-binding protein [Candidatus Omnitrophica bacterium CG23_combo_of_CG06-09_8_20_14_all_41_10]PIS33297.1 MAG: multidrug ABC transporter ATP-binding protein [Candidatus Omnitrophica bacterium CG08_land_8_20_14_0_20_41_16]
MNEKIIEVKNLSKHFGQVLAVKDISFEVKRSEIFAFLGPNGAGKTTTIKMFITLLAPTSGDATISGYSVIHHPAEVRKVIGYVPQMISVDGALTVQENLMLMAHLYDVPYRERNERIQQMLAFLNLEKYAQSLVRTLSGGMIRKLEVGQAMLHHPHLLFLDEPTTGLDPIAKRNIWEHLAELRDTFGTTIFFSTHNMEEAEETCDRVAIMNDGEIAVIGSVSELKDKTNKKDATLEDAFIFFAGNSLEPGGNFHDIKQTRQTHHRLG